MRVITGEKRGARLIAPDGLDTRPTGEKVKEALFSIIQFELENASFLDLFSGSGQMGIEALSRGARCAVFVDFGKKPSDCIRANLKSTGLEERGEFVMRDVPGYLDFCREKFDIVFADPPYKAGLIPEVLEKVTKVMNENGIVICEIPAREPLLDEVNDFSLVKRYRYGKTELALYRSGSPEREIY